MTKRCGSCFQLGYSLTHNNYDANWNIQGDKCKNYKQLQKFRGKITFDSRENENGRFGVKEGYGAYKLDTGYKKTRWIEMRVRKGNHKRKDIKTGSRG